MLLFSQSSPTRYFPGGKYRMFWVAPEAALIAACTFDVTSVAPVLSTRVVGDVLDVRVAEPRRIHLRRVDQDEEQLLGVDLQDQVVRAAA